MFVNLGIIKVENLPAIVYIPSILYGIIMHIAIYAAFSKKIRLFHNLLVSFLSIMGFIRIISTNSIFGLSEPKFDDLHKLIARVHGIFLIFIAFLLWQSIQGNDGTKSSSFLWCWMMKLIGTFMAQAYLIRKLPSSSPNVLTAEEFLSYGTFIGLVVWITLVLYVLFTSPTWGGYVQGSSVINTHLFVENMFLLICGLSFYAFPKWLIKDLSTVDRLDKYHVYLSHTASSLIVFVGMLSGQVVHYLYEKDKAKYLGSHVFVYASVTTLMIYSRLTSGIFGRRNFYIALAALVVMSTNACLGYISVFHASWIKALKKKL